MEITNSQQRTLRRIVNKLAGERKPIAVKFRSSGPRNGDFANVNISSRVYQKNFEKNPGDPSPFKRDCG